MRKSLFLTLVLSLCMTDFGAFAATRRGTVAAAQETQTAPVAARAAMRNTAPKTSAAASTTVQTGRVAKVSAAPVKVSTATTMQKAQQPSSAGVVARAATKKALAMGTKVSTATENTAVSQECQDAYYGCMDAFCMLDNAAGGRCQCSDRVVELDAVMDEIMRIDEQSMRIATEGVEQVQMGEYADQITSRAKSIESGIKVSKESKKATTSSKIPSLSLTTSSFDLSAWSNSNIFDDGEETEPEVDNSINISAVEDLAGKLGDDLQKSAARVCTAQIPKECKASSALLQMAYVSKVKSDCIGYENALKQQKSASQQKLLTAQKAVRDAVLTDVREKNKYATAGECALAFTECMQTTAGCGSDYTGCVILAASENVRNNKSGSRAKQTKIKGVVSGADITLAATTMESLLAKKEICASVTRQCVNANKNDAVWDIFLRNAAPALKSAELIAEQNLRSNCIPTVAECFRNACKSRFGEDDESYDICLSNPATYKSLCKVQLEPCLEATGGSYDKAEDSSLWNGLVAMLNSMKVDACTKEVKDCLLSEDRCGPDYAACIGLDSQTIANICPVEKLTACVADGKYADGEGGTNDQAIRQYVAQVAQGLALNIDNSFLTQCQNAASEAMIKVCGDTESCENVTLDLSSLAGLMKVQACTLQKDKDGKDSSYCLPDISQFTDDEIYSFGYTSNSADAKLVRQSSLGGGKSGYGVYATLLDKPDISHIEFDNETKKFVTGDVVTTLEGSKATQLVDYFSKASTDSVVSILDSTLERLMGQLETDPKVIYCKSGRKVEGFDGTKFGKDATDGGGRFPNLTDEYRYTIANGLVAKLSEKNMEVVESFDDEILAMSNKITERVAEIAKKRGEAVEQAVDEKNKNSCIALAGGRSADQAKFFELHEGNGWCRNYLSYNQKETYRVANYNPDTNVCVLETKVFNCTDWGSGGLWCSKRCFEFDQGTVTKTENINMPKFQ